MTLRSILATLSLLVIWTTGAAAHGPTPHKIDETVTIAAPPAKVWALISDFSALAHWHPLVASSVVEGGNAPDAARKLVLKSGGTLTESLDTYDAAAMSYSYRLYEEDVKAFPVSSYFADLSVRPEGTGSVVEWAGRFYRGDTGNDPPDDLNDDAAIKAMTGFFESGLNNLKKLAEQ